MSPLDEPPKISKLPFFVIDGVLLATAAFIASREPAPLSTAAILAIVGCIALGALLTAIPFILDASRRQEALLAERQAALEALAKITAASAEQIGIATTGLHGTTEAATRSLKAAEELPQRLEEKLAELKKQLGTTVASENAARQQETQARRTAESERLEAGLGKITQATAEIREVEANWRRDLAPLAESLARLPTLAEQTAQRWESTLALCEKRLQEVAARSQEQIAASLAQQLSTTLAALEKWRLAAGESLRAVRPEPPPAQPPSKAPSSPAPASPSPATSGEEPPPPPKAAPAPQSVVAAAPAPAGASEADPPSPADDERAQVETAASSANALPPSEASRKRPARKAADAGPELALGLDEAKPTALDAATSLAPSTETRAASSDGQTRLLVTAYIGIGNKLYVRGQGPGLDSQKGVPLQFVSIGKWRWETSEATAPLTLTLYKNDTEPCANLGPLTLPPGQQIEVTANF